VVELKPKIDKETGIIIRYDDKGRPYISIPVGSVPYEQGIEWLKDCEERFNGNRWLKIQHDHLKSQNFDLQTSVEFLRLELEKKQKEDERQTMVPDMNPLGLLNGGEEENGE